MPGKPMKVALLSREGEHIGWAYRMRADGYKPRKTWPMETVKTGG